MKLPVFAFALVLCLCGLSQAQEQQRIFGIIPNFYISYEQDAAPLTTKLKFQLAAKVLFDPVTFFGVGLVAASEQAGNHPITCKGRRVMGSATALPMGTALPTS